MGRPIAKRGRIPGRTENPRLRAHRPPARTCRSMPATSEGAYELFRRGSRLLAKHHAGPRRSCSSGAWPSSRARPRSSRRWAEPTYEQGPHRLAAERFAAIVDANPLADYAHFGLGLSHARLGDPRAGLRHLKMAASCSRRTRTIAARWSERRAPSRSTGAARARGCRPPTSRRPRARRRWPPARRGG